MKKKKMMKNIDRIIKENINSFLISEGLDNMDNLLYHNTSLENLLKMMKTNSMSSGHHRGYNNKGHHSGICFTRSKKYNPYTYYVVKMSFSPQNLLNSSKGLKLVPYQDIEYSSLDEYEERLISKNERDFVLDNLSERVNDIVIDIEDVVEWVNEEGQDAEDVVQDLCNIVSNNIFGDKLKIIINNGKGIREVPLDSDSIREAYLIIDNGGEDEYNSIYCVEIYDEEEGDFIEDIYCYDELQAFGYAKQYYEKNGIPTRITLCDKDSHELMDIIKQYG